MLVSQGSVNTLFRRGEKHLHFYAANIFKTIHAKFRENRLGFVEDTTKTISVHSVYMELSSSIACLWDVSLTLCCKLCMQ